MQSQFENFLHNEIVSKITTHLKKRRGKTGLYLICLNASQKMTKKEVEEMKTAALGLINFLLKDQNNLIGVYPLSEEIKQIDTHKLPKRFEVYQSQIEGMPQTVTRPLTVLNNFAKNWRRSTQNEKGLDVFVVVLSSAALFNPGPGMFKNFTDKKLNLIPCIFGGKKVLCREQTLKFATSEDLNTKLKSLLHKTESLKCRVDVIPDFYSASVKFTTPIAEPELEIYIYQVTDGTRIPVDNIFTNQTLVKIEKLEPGFQYILKYRFNFSDGMNSIFFEEASFQTLSKSIRDIELFSPLKVKDEVAEMRHFIQEVHVTNIEKLMDVRSYNILLFGRIGAGKSSLASTMHRAATGKFNPNFAYVDFTHTSCTKQLNKLELFECSPVRIWDTFGVDDSNYDNSVLENILEGKMGDTYQQGEGISKKKVTLGDSVHTVILVVDVQMFSEKEELEKLRQKVNKIKEKRYYPILIITKLDTLKVKSCKDIYKVKEGEDIIKTAHEHFRVDKNNIFFMINYKGEEAPDYYKELMALKILEKAVERAKHFLNQNKKILIKEVSGKPKKIFPLLKMDISLAELRKVYGAQIMKMLKCSDFDFVEYLDEDEEDVYLNDICQIDEEHGERIRYLDVKAKTKGTTKVFCFQQGGDVSSNTLNCRDSEFDMDMKSLQIKKNGIDEEEMLHHLDSQNWKKSYGQNYEITKNFEINLVDSENLNESVIFYTDQENETTEEEQYQYDDGMTEEYPPIRSKVQVVINGKGEGELEEVDLKSSLYSLRKSVSQQFPKLQEGNFAFTKKVNDKDLFISRVYENESEIRVEQVIKQEDQQQRLYISLRE